MHGRRHIIIFGRPFLNTCGAVIDCKKEKSLTKFDGEPYEFNFSKFTRPPYETDLPNEDFRVEQLASISLLLMMLCSNIWRVTKVRSSRKKEMRLTRFFFVSPRCLNTINPWRIWVPLYHLRKILFFI
jgi:hypothetical protein